MRVVASQQKASEIASKKKQGGEPEYLIGAYEEGSDPKVDYAIEKIEEVNLFLKQDSKEKVDLADSVAELKGVFE